MTSTIYTLSCTDAIDFVCEATQGFAELDDQGNFKWANRAYADILNAPIELILNTPQEKWTHTADRKIENTLLNGVREGSAPGFTLAKRYIRRGSTPKRPLVIWGTLKAHGKFTETGEFVGCRVQFSPLPNSSYLQWGTLLLDHWKAVATVVTLLSTLILGSSERSQKLLQWVQSIAQSVDTEQESLSPGP